MTDYQLNELDRHMRRLAAWATAAELEARTTVDPDHRQMEQTTENNQAYVSFQVHQDLFGPKIDVSFDGQGVLSGDYVSTTPLIRVQLRDNSRASLRDASGVAVFLNGKVVPFGNKSDLEFVSLSGDGDLRAEVLYRPVLNSGNHDLRIVAVDFSGNASEYSVRVRTDNNLTLRDVYNYPNPFPQATDILYYLTQDAIAVSATIYTVAGRRIRELRPLPNVVGFNRFQWDGRDADGDRLATGTYLCRLVARDTERETSHTLKMVIIR